VLCAWLQSILTLSIYIWTAVRAELLWLPHLVIALKS
jgi:hypothetical protein